MDGTQPGESGVLSWCNTIRFSMAQDPSRQFLHVQIKEKGFDFLDTYLENILSKPTEGHVYDLLKTPGRKKNASKRARTATDAATKSESVASNLVLQDRSKGKENAAPMNDLHKVLLEAKTTDEDALETTAKHISMTFSNDTRRGTTEPNEDASRRALPIPKPEDSTDSPIQRLTSTSIDKKDEDISTTGSISSAAPAPGQPIINVTEIITSSSRPQIPNELSMIAEDEESEEQSKPVSPPLEQEDQDMVAGMVVPVKDEDGTAPNTLNRKPSISHFGGLPAPSPLRKSTRFTREPSLAPGLVHTPGTGLGSKRTSWLTKAKEAKAREMSDPGKKANSLAGLGIAGVDADSGPKKRKSDDMDVDVAGAAKASSESDERKFKSARTSHEKNLASASANDVEASGRAESHSHSLPDDASHRFVEESTVPIRDPSPDEGALDRFKKILGARSEKSLGKSLSGAAAAALAEAKAAAEARVAHQYKENEDVYMEIAPEPSSVPSKPESFPPPTGHEPPINQDRRLSVSDLIPPSTQQPTQPPRTSNDQDNASMSTTPPNSPPVLKTLESRPAPLVFKPPPPPTSEFKAPPPPVFKPVFTAPPPAATQAPRPIPSSNAVPGPAREFSFKLPDSKLFSRPVATTLGVPASLNPTPPKQPSALSAQTSAASIFSDAIFDKQDDIPAWMPSTQDTDYSIQPSQIKSRQEELEKLENEDPIIWPIADQFSANHMWTPYGFTSGDQDDTMTTYSTVASQRDETGVLQVTQGVTEAMQQAAREHADTMMTGTTSNPDGHALRPNAEVEAADMAMNVDTDGVDTDMEDILRTGKSTVSLVEPKGPPGTRQQSMTSTSSSQSQSQLGFFGQASRLVSSYLGGKKTKNEPVKSIQLAAAAAKKQQEEADKRSTRLKEMEARRQQVLQRKADEEKARALEEERKAKEDIERRKREREEHTEKRVLRPAKVDEDPAKKRKVATETEKKPDPRKPPLRAQPSRLTKPTTAATPTTKLGAAMKSAMKQPSSSQLATAIPAGSSTAKEPPRQLKTAASTSSLKSAIKGKAKAGPVEEQPSQMLQSQMAHRANAHIQAVQPRPPPQVPSESIELPDVHSEYEFSDEEGERRRPSFDPPEWAQSPELRQALQQQSMINPDAIFGPIGPLRMEEIFKSRQSRYRARTSSANWSGADRLTAEEQEEYARKMGYQ